MGQPTKKQPMTRGKPFTTPGPIIQQQNLTINRQPKTVNKGKHHCPWKDGRKTHAFEDKTCIEKGHAAYCPWCFVPCSTFFGCPTHGFKEDELLKEKPQNYMEIFRWYAQQGLQGDRRRVRAKMASMGKVSEFPDRGTEESPVEDEELEVQPEVGLDGDVEDQDTDEVYFADDEDQPQLRPTPANVLPPRWPAMLPTTVVEVTPEDRYIFAQDRYVFAHFDDEEAFGIPLLGDNHAPTTVRLRKDEFDDEADVLSHQRGEFGAEGDSPDPTDRRVNQTRGGPARRGSGGGRTLRSGIPRPIPPPKADNSTSQTEDTTRRGGRSGRRGRGDHFRRPSTPLGTTTPPEATTTSTPRVRTLYQVQEKGAISLHYELPRGAAVIPNVATPEPMLTPEVPHLHASLRGRRGPRGRGGMRGRGRGRGGSE
ncbi:hypothetical protein PMZ80_001781 [Knufia obscura]|uniref:Uncharacterized protein n=1 Tax=Knufia obscura TaxID=1635080 RepID=A0ABR0S587_9EURO|nr:hypothetical protein PMZ80_001781 [Knufia obscura]